MPLHNLRTQIADWDIEQIEIRLDYIHAHIDCGGKCSQANAIEILNIADRALKIAKEAEEDIVKETEEGFE